MKKIYFLSLLAFCLSSYGQPITNISTINSHTANYLNQGFFLQATVDSALQNSKWLVTDGTGSIRCNFSNVSSPTLGQNITIVGTGTSDGGFEVLVNFYYNPANPPNIGTVISTLHSNPQNAKPVKIDGEITGLFSGSLDDYYLEDASGVIKADWDILMNVPDFFVPITVWGITDYDPNSYIDVDVWAWYYAGVQGLEEFDISKFINPNPISSFLKIDLPENITSLVIYDMLGKAVITTTGNEELIDVSALSKGLYVISIYSDKLLVGETKLIKN